MKNSLFSPSLWLLWIHYVSWNEGFYFLASWPWSSRETIYCFCISEWICSLWQMKGSLCVKIKWTFYPPAREEHFQRQPMRWNLITICFSDKKKQGVGITLCWHALKSNDVLLPLVRADLTAQEMWQLRFKHLGSNRITDLCIQNAWVLSLPSTSPSGWMQSRAGLMNGHALPALGKVLFIQWKICSIIDFHNMNL